MSFMQTIGSRIVLEGFAKYIDQLSKAERETKGFGSAVEGQSGKASHAFSNFTKATGLGALGAAGAIAGIGVASIKLASDFESTMSRIAGLTSTPESAISGLREQILKLSTEVAISPNELGAGAYFILSSGINDTATAMKVLELSAKAAKAGLGETQVIASTVTSVMNAYGFSVDEAERATNALVNTVKLGKGEPADLAHALGFIIPVAAQMGVEIEEVGGILATLTNTGLGAENAVTALKGVFTQILSPSDQSREAFERLGLSVEVFRQRVREDAGGALADLVKRASTGSAALTGLGLSIEQLSELTKRSIDRIRSKPKEVASAFDELSASTGLSTARMAELLDLPLDALNNLTAEEAIKSIVTLQASLSGADSVLAELFPDVRGLTGVLGAFGVQGEATARNIQGMKDGTDALDVAFKAASQTTAFKFSQAMVSLQAAMIQLGAVALPVVAKIATGVSKLIGAFIKLPGPVKVALVVGGALAAAFLTVAGAALILAPGIIAIATAFTGTGIAAGFLSTALLPLLIIPLAIAAALVGLVAVAILLEKKFHLFSETILPALSSAFQAVAGVVGPILQRALTQLTQLWAGLQPALSAAGEALVAVGKVALEVAGFLKEHPILLGAIAVALGVVLSPLIATAVAFAAVPLAIAGVIAAGVAFLALWDDIRRVVSNALDVFGELPIIGSIVDGVADAIVGRLQFIVRSFERLFDAVSNVVSLLKNLLQGDFSAAFDNLKALVGIAMNQVIDQFLQPLRDLKSALGPLLGELGPLILSGLEALPGLVGKAGEHIGQAIIDGIAAGAEAAWAVHGFIPRLPGLILRAVKKGIPVVAKLGKQLIGGLLNGAASAAPQIARFGTSLPGLFLDGAKAQIGIAKHLGSLLISAFVDGLKSASSSIATFVSTLPGVISSAASALPGVLSSVGKSVIEGFVVAISAAWEGADDFFYGLPNLILGILGDLGALLLDVGKAVVTGLFDGVKFLWEREKAFWSDLPGTVIGLIGDVTRTLYQLGDDILAGFFSGVKFVYEGNKRFFSELPGNLVALIGDLGSKLVGAGAALLTGLKTGIDNVYNGLAISLPTLGASLANLIVGGFKGAWNGIAGFINNAIPNDITIPGVSILGKSVFPETKIDLPDNPLPKLARGTRSFAGGLAIVGEAGPELAALPRGSKVWPHSETMGILDALIGGLPGFQGGLGLDTAFSGLSSILALVQKLLAKIPASLFNSNLKIPSFEHGGYVPAGQQMLAQLHGPEKIVPLRGSMTASAPGMVVNISAPVSVTINEMNWAQVKAVALRAVDEALSGARSSALRQGAPLSSGVG